MGQNVLTTPSAPDYISQSIAAIARATRLTPDQLADLCATQHATREELSVVFNRLMRNDFDPTEAIETPAQRALTDALRERMRGISVLTPSVSNASGFVSSAFDTTIFN